MSLDAFANLASKSFLLPKATLTFFCKKSPGWRSNDWASTVSTSCAALPPEMLDPFSQLHPTSDPQLICFHRSMSGRSFERMSPDGLKDVSRARSPRCFIKTILRSSYLSDNRFDLIHIDIIMLSQVMWDEILLNQLPIQGAHLSSSTSIFTTLFQ